MVNNVTDTNICVISVAEGQQADTNESHRHVHLAAKGGPALAQTAMQIILCERNQGTANKMATVAKRAQRVKSWLSFIITAHLLFAVNTDTSVNCEQPYKLRLCVTFAKVRVYRNSHRKGVRHMPRSLNTQHCDLCHVAVVGIREQNSAATTAKQVTKMPTAKFITMQ